MTYNDSFLHIFFRFLRFGALAWGGPVAQIAMLRQELVKEENWISKEWFPHLSVVVSHRYLTKSLPPLDRKKSRFLDL